MRELFDRLQEPEPGLAVRIGSLFEKTAFDQRLQQIEFRVADRLHCVEAAAVDEHGQASKQASLVLVEQVVAPGDRRSEGLLALLEITSAAGQHAQPLVQAAEQGLRREHNDSRGRELEREREPIDASADLCNRCDVVSCRREVRLRGACT